METASESLQKVGYRMTLEEIFTMSDQARRSLNQKELSALVSYSAKKLNARLGRLAKRPDVADYALKNVQETGGRFGAKGKTYNQLQKELSRMKDFYESKTSTVKGAREVAEKWNELVFGTKSPKRTGRGKITIKQQENITKKVFKAYRKFEESHPSLRGHGSAKYIREIGRIKSDNKRASQKSLIEAAEKMFTEEYAKEQSARKEVESDLWKDLFQ